MIVCCSQSRMAGDHLEETLTLQKLLDTTKDTLSKSGEKVQQLNSEVIVRLNVHSKSGKKL